MEIYDRHRPWRPAIGRTLSTEAAGDGREWLRGHRRPAHLRSLIPPVSMPHADARSSPNRLARLASTQPGPGAPPASGKVTATPVPHRSRACTSSPKDRTRRAGVLNPEVGGLPLRSERARG
jgi:hypothetical protein